MRILMVHNFYAHPGGEDRVFRSERDLLRERGQDVWEFTRTSPGKLSLTRIVEAASSPWNPRVYTQLRAVLTKFRPDVVHFHNAFPLLSAAAFDAVQHQQVPAVQTLHNFRLAGCINGLRFRDHERCDSCVTARNSLSAVRHACYRASRAQTAFGLLVHHVAHLSRGKRFRYIALNQNAKRIFVESGIDEASIAVKGNFAPEPNRLRDPLAADHALYVGRLSPEKGVDVAIEAWKQTRLRLPLVIAGGGPAERTLRQQAAGANVHFLGNCSSDAIQGLMRRAACLIVPSKCDEMFPMVIAEAFALGLPVVASRTPALETLIQSRQSGLLFPIGDSKLLADSVAEIVRDHDVRVAMSAECRRQYAATMSPTATFEALMDIYRSAVNN